MKTLKTLLLVILSTSLYAQKDTTFLENWQSYPISVNKDTLLRDNYSPGMVVYRDNGKIKAEREVYRDVDDLPFKIIPLSNNSELDQFSGTRKVLKVADGYLVGYNRGEFGGSLFWFSADGKKYYITSNINLQ
jgi:hypothetical protein